ATQDDAAVIASPVNGFGYRADEAGGTPATAAALTVLGNSYSAAGVIATITDVDAYRFTLSAAGNVNFNLNVAPLGAMLDGTLELLDSNGTAIKVSDTASLGETLTMDLLPGTYFVA